MYIASSSYRYLFKRNEPQFVKHLLLSVLMAAFIVNLAALLLAVAIGNVTGAIIYIFTVPTIILSIGLLRNDYFTFVSAIVVYGIFALALYRAYVTLGVYAPIYMSLPVVLLVASFIYQAETGIILAIIASLNGLVMVFAAQQGIIDTSSVEGGIPIINMWTASANVFLVTAFLGYYARRTMDKAAKDARINEQTLAERNQVLQKEIDQRHDIEKALLYNQSLYQSVVEDQPNFIARWLPDGTLVFVNDAYCKFHGKTSEDLIGANFFLWTPDDAVATFKQKAAQMTPDNAVMSSVHQDVDNDGNVIWHQWTDRGIFDENGTLIVIQSVGLDITVQKQLEENLVSLQVTREREAFLKDFLSTITHDLKTPLSVMNTSIYLAQRLPSEDARNQQLQQMRRQIRLLEKMINNILSVVRLRNLPELNFEPTAVNPMIDELQQGLQPKADSKSIDLIKQLEQTMPQINADADQLERVLLNLIDNALNYTPSGGTVTVTTQSLPEHVQIVVQDTGIGIPKADQPFIFDQFYRAQNAKNIEGGTGLGLAIVKRIIELHNGTIEVDSEEHVGTTFRLTLPVMAEVVAAG